MGDIKPHCFNGILSCVDFLDAILGDTPFITCVGNGL